MSRIGKKEIQIPEGVKVTLENRTIKIVGPKGELTKTFPKLVNIKIEGNVINISVDEESNNLWGLWRTLVANMITGVVDGFQKELEIHGVGYRAVVEGGKLTLSLGFSHPVEIDPPDKIEFQVQKNKIIISGIDKEVVGELAAHIRSLRKPEPYKGKGIKYVGEVIRRKAGKAAKTVGGAPGAA